mmetsp:Transcript_9489/g.14541  ORF Transcript_9489/g.14541 Transcript_9489/m.14541 type:complete len:203 (-) Transcript_9489:817-1425(-)
MSGGKLSAVILGARAALDFEYWLSPTFSLSSMHMLDMTEPFSAKESVSKIVCGLTDSTSCLCLFKRLCSSSFTFFHCSLWDSSFWSPRDGSVTRSSICAFGAIRMRKPFSSRCTSEEPPSPSSSSQSLYLSMTSCPPTNFWACCFCYRDRTFSRRFLTSPSRSSSSRCLSSSCACLTSTLDLSWLRSSFLSSRSRSRVVSCL